MLRPLEQMGLLLLQEKTMQANVMYLRGIILQASVLVIALS